MESLFTRYRNIIVLLLVLCGQIILLAWQVRSDTDVPMVRVWAVSAVAPVASGIETLRNATTGFFTNYFELRNAREQSRGLHTEVDRLRLENQFLKNELASAQRAEALAGFQARTPSKMVGARVIGATPGVGTTSVLIDRGSSAGVRRGMAVVTPDGIMGRVLEVFPFASQVLSITDPAFSAGVESQKNHVHGVLKGLGNGSAKIDYVPTGQKVDVGEMFFTSGEDRVFPRGLPAGKVISVQEGGSLQEITVQPSGAGAAPEEVLVIVDPVHQTVPKETPADTPVFLGPDIASENKASAGGVPQQQTAAGQLMDQYKKIGDTQKHVFGVGGPGTPPPNFNLKVPGVNAPAAAPNSAASAKPPADKPPAADKAPVNKAPVDNTQPDRTPVLRPPAEQPAPAPTAAPSTVTPPRPAPDPPAPPAEPQQ